MLIKCLTYYVMFLKNIACSFILFLCFLNFNFAQNGFAINNKKGVDKINFKLINNIIIVPITVNGVELSFLLDSGVNKPIVFNFLNVTDSLNNKYSEKIYLKGLGNGGLTQALKSKNNTFVIGNTTSYNQDFYIVLDSSINFAPYLGVPIHGIIGYDIFKNLIVDINYTKKQLKLSNHKNYKPKKCKKCEYFKLQFHKNKPYINLKAKINNKQVPLKLLIDTGSSDSLWLFKDDSLGIVNTNKRFSDFLGFGLSGSIHGTRSIIETITINSYNLNKPKVSFPNEEYLTLVKQIDGRNGSIGGEILKRFNLTINYKDSIIKFKKNKNFNTIFSYNKSGITIIKEGIRLVEEIDNSNVFTYASQNENSSNNTYSLNTKFDIKPAFVIWEIRDNSPAFVAGLKKGDVVLRINNVDTKNYSLQQLTAKFFKEEGKKITLTVDRNGQLLKYKFLLKSPLK